MVKFVFAAIWICLATIGSMYYAFSAASSTPSEEEKPAFFGGLDYVKTDVISVPVLDAKGIGGYFLTRLVYTIEPEKMNKLSLPAEALLIDTIYTHLYANPQIDFTKYTELDLDAFRHGIRDAVNERVGDTLVHEVVVEQIDFLTKQEIRDNTIRRKPQSIDAEAREKEASEAQTPAKEGH